MAPPAGIVFDNGRPQLGLIWAQKQLYFDVIDSENITMYVVYSKRLLVLVPIVIIPIIMYTGNTGTLLNFVVSLVIAAMFLLYTMYTMATLCGAYRLKFSVLPSRDGRILCLDALFKQPFKDEEAECIEGIRVVRVNTDLVGRGKSSSLVYKLLIEHGRDSVKTYDLFQDSTTQGESMAEFTSRMAALASLGAGGGVDEGDPVARSGRVGVRGGGGSDGGVRTDGVAVEMRGL